MPIWLFVRSSVILQLNRSFRLWWTIMRWRLVVKWTIIGITLSGVFIPILCAMSIQGSGISTFKSLNNYFLLSNTSFQNHLYWDLRSLDKAFFFPKTFRSITCLRAKSVQDLATCFKLLQQIFTYFIHVIYID